MASSTSDSNTSDRLDVAIVGGGVSGLYTAWRLLVDARQRKAPAPSITIYEMHDRVGGRLLTWLPLGPDVGLRAELGGMRFNEGHVLVWHLLAQLGFKPEDIVEFHVGGPHLRLLLRGVSTPLRTEDPTARYLLPSSEKGAHAGKLIEGVAREVLATPKNVAVLKKLLGKASPPTARKDWDKIKPFLTWKGKALWDLGFWNLMSDVRTPETYQYVLDAAGYYTNAANWNAGEALQGVYAEPSAPHPDAPAYKTLKEGYNALPDALHDKVVELGCNIELNTRLASFDAKPGGSRLNLAGPKGKFTVEAERLFLAMPRRSLELLGPSETFDLQADPELKSLVEATTPYPAFKLFLFYSERWWEKYGIKWGRSISDLPLRQTYYFPPDSLDATAAGLLMASYDDERAVDYWRGLVPPEDQREQGRAELHQALVELARSGGLAGGATAIVEEPPPHLHKATDAMLRHAKDQLALLHDVPVDELPDPVVGAFADWDLDPFGGGWNQWAAQVNVKEAMTRIKIPLGNERRVHVIGEAYSGIQGWVEGALTTAEVVLQKYLGLAPPSWLPNDYYLGW